MKYESHFSVLKELTSDIEKETREDALAIDQLVVLATPVDTGRARGNWQASVGTKISTESSARGASAALNQARSAIGNATNFNYIYIQNNLPYINKLNEGSSIQAPMKFIERAMETVANANKR